MAADIYFPVGFSFPSWFFFLIPTRNLDSSRKPLFFSILHARLEKKNSWILLPEDSEFQMAVPRPSFEQFEHFIGLIRQFFSYHSTQFFAILMSYLPVPLLSLINIFFLPTFGPLSNVCLSCLFQLPVPAPSSNSPPWQLLPLYPA